ncbi:MAG: type I-E CRISPR-associated endoribonuclease Cas2e [Hyphomicrobiaceae bacterium]
MTVIVTRNVAPRFRGFLASVMLEIAPGVYTAPEMSKGVRERIWSVLSEWFPFGATSSADPEQQASIVLTWRDKAAPGGQGIETLGVAAKSLVEADGFYVVNWLKVPNSATA